MKSGSIVRSNSSTIAFQDPNLYKRAKAKRLKKCSQIKAVEKEGKRKIGTQGAAPLAIVGIGLRLPGGATDASSFWSLLHNGVDAISEIPEDRWSITSFYDPRPNMPGQSHSKWGGFIEGNDLFDASFFSVSPHEAESMDPQQRLLLETAWHTFEDAGEIPVRSAASNIGVYVGISYNEYARFAVSPVDHVYSVSQGSGAFDATGTAMSISANRISHAFNFKGPSMAIDTACSSSLVAFNEACRAVWDGECEAALVAGVNHIIDPSTWIAFCSLGALSPDGRCKAFDASANGFVRGEGVGAVLVKPLDDAIRDNNRVYACVRGTAVNQDGYTPAIAMPNRESQEKLIRHTCDLAGVTPEQIDFVEAHGTGTGVGDPIEANALGNALGAEHSPKHPLYISSVKTNIGHLESAAGIAGLIKAALCIHHRHLPPSLHFKDPNPAVDFEALNLQVVTENLDFSKRNGDVLRASVNSFGFGGANAHAILESAPPLNSRTCAEPTEMISGRFTLPLSAKSSSSLRQLASSYAAEIRENPKACAEILSTAASQRARLTQRLTAIGNSPKDLADTLTSITDLGEGAEIPSGVHYGTTEVAPETRPVFVFSGQGSQWAGMGRDLYKSSSLFRETFDRCHSALRKISRGRFQLRDEVFATKKNSNLSNTAIAQPAIFAIQISLAKLWESWGVHPAAVVGHSVGEVAAAYIAGALSFEDAVRVIYHRGSKMESARIGRMIAAEITPEEALEAIHSNGGGLSLAACNGPSSVSISGEPDAVDHLYKLLQQRNIFCRYVPVDYAFHSDLMDPVRSRLISSLSGITPKRSHSPIFSTVTGKKLTGTRFNADYWWRNVRQTVRFSEVIENLAQDGHEVFLEINAHPVLQPSLVQCLRNAGTGDTSDVYPSIRRDASERDTLLGSLAALHNLGLEIDWSGLLGKPSKHVDLPKYPFDRQRFWRETPAWKSARLTPRPHPYLHVDIPSPRSEWMFFPDRREHPYLNDHVVSDRIVFPASGYIEMAMAVARAHYKTSDLILEDVEFQRVLFIPRDGPAAVIRAEFEPEKGSFRILSTSDEKRQTWTLHALGRIRVQEAEETEPKREPNRIREAQKRCPDATDIAAAYRLLEESGLRYGPLFRGMTEAAFSESEGWSRIEIPEAIFDIADGYILHPVLLDSAFHVMALLPNKTPGTFLPVELRRLSIHQANAKVAFCHARLIYSTPSMYETDIALLDEKGALIAELTGFRLLAVESARTDYIPDVTFDFLEEKWSEAKPKGDEQSKTASIIPFPAPSAIVSHLREVAPKDEIPLEMLRRNSPLFSLAIQRALVRLGYTGKKGDTFTATEIREQLMLPERSSPLLLRLLKTLEQDKTIRRVSRSEQWHINKSLSRNRYETSWKKALEKSPELSTELIFLNLIADNLGAFLRAETTPTKLLAAKTNAHLPAQFFGESAWIQPAHDLLKRSLEKLTDSLPKGRKLGVMEIAGGNRQTSGHILSQLPPNKIQYLLTDQDPEQLADLADKLHPYENLRALPFSPSRSLSSQEFSPASVDVILWSHPGKLSISHLRRIRQLLRPGGMLLHLQAKEAPVLFDFFKSSRAKGYELCDEPPKVAETKALLKSAGFEKVSHLDTNSCLGHRLFLSSAPMPKLPAKVPSPKGKRQKGRWLIFPEPSATITGSLAKKLQDAGDSVSLVKKSDIPENREQCIEYLSSIKPIPKGIIYLGALETEISERQSLRSLRATSEATCLVPLFIAQALDALSEKYGETSLWLATSGAREIPEYPEEVNLAHAPLAGMTRVIHSELRSHTVRHVDFSRDIADRELDLFCDDLVSGQEETQVGYRGEARLVPRLETCPPHAQRSAQRLPLHESPSRLITRQAGVFDHLTLQQIERTPPAKGEIEVEIHAAGLNFRDVMKALGIYPTDAEDAGLFGDDFGGVITAVGAGVSHLKPGDRVFGVRPGCFRTHLTIPEALVLPLADHISFEEASTIPSIYLTAWYALHELGRIKKGERVLIHAGAGGVGLAAIRLAQHAGAEIFATAGSPLKRDFLRTLGVPHVFDSRTLKFADDIYEATNGEGIDIVLNSLAGQAIPRSLECLREGGRFLELGKRDIYENSEIGLRPFKNCLTYIAIDLARQISPARFKVLVAKVKRLVDQDIIKPLPHAVFPVTRAQEAFRHMAQGRHIGKLVLNFDSQSAIAEPELDRSKGSFSSNGTYLITGGTRGFGLEVAEFLANRGARHLVLVSRSGKSVEESSATLAAIKATGAKVELKACDVSSREELRSLLSTIRTKGSQLKGIFHGAMVLEDEVLTRMTPSQFEAVIGPKTLGAWNLHQQTLKDSLDHFVLFSSISVLVGNPGQANYVAANAFLDSLAGYRRQKGKPGLSIAWDRLNESGYAARTEGLAEHFERLGWKGLTNREAMRGLELLLNNKAEHMAVSNVDWSIWQSAAGLSAQIPYYEKLISEDSSAGSGEDLAERVRQQFFAAPADQRVELVEGFIIEQVAKVLRISPNRLSKTKPLNEQGLDSLMAVELFGVLENQLGVPIPPSQLIENPTVEKAAASIAHILETQEGAPSTTDTNTPGEQDAEPKKTPSPQEDLEEFTRKIQADCKPSGKATSDPPKKIFLTGATGFFGPHLLEALLRTTGATIHCLVRAGSDAAARKRLQARLRSAGIRISKPIWDKRIRIIPGDLSQPQLDLPNKTWENLSRNIDTIIHGAASVNHSSEYSEIRASDVGGTFELLRLAATNRTKHFHYLSSLAVFSASKTDGSATRKESDLPDPLESLFNGYGQCKAVSETLIREAGKLGIPVNIFRIGHLVSESEPSTSASRQALWLVLRGCLFLEFAPEYTSNLQITPVAWAAATLSRAIEQRIVPSTRHVASSFTTTFEDLLDHARKLGYQIETLDRADWISRLRKLGEDQQIGLYARFFPEMEIADVSVSDIGVLEDKEFREFIEQLPASSRRFPEESWNAESLLVELRKAGFFPEPGSEKASQEKPTTALAT